MSDEQKPKAKPSLTLTFNDEENDLKCNVQILTDLEPSGLPEDIPNEDLRELFDGLRLHLRLELRRRARRKGN